MKHINTLIDDIYEIVGSQNKVWATEDWTNNLGLDIAKSLQTQHGDRSERRGLRLSQMGPKCPRSLWYSVHNPELADPIQPWVQIKFSYGHILEAYAIALAKAAGHHVTGEQDELVVDGVSGHRDCVIDGCIVDVKSTNSRSFEKFKNGTLGQNDLFGYLDQLDGYLVGSHNDPLVHVKDRAYLFAIDKTLGHMCLYEHRIREEHIRQRIRSYRKIVESDTPPACTCGTIADGKSGNIRLDTRASYNPFKHACFPNLRTFLYASGPVYLTKVVRTPDVIEIRK